MFLHPCLISSPSVTFYITDRSLSFFLMGVLTQLSLVYKYPRAVYQGYLNSPLLE